MALRFDKMMCFARSRAALRIIWSEDLRQSVGRKCWPSGAGWTATGWPLHLEPGRDVGNDLVHEGI